MNFEFSVSSSNPASHMGQFSARSELLWFHRASSLFYLCGRRTQTSLILINHFSMGLDSHPESDQVIPASFQCKLKVNSQESELIHVDLVRLHTGTQGEGSRHCLVLSGCACRADS